MLLQALDRAMEWLQQDARGCDTSVATDIAHDADDASAESHDHCCGAAPAEGEEHLLPRHLSQSHLHRRKDSAESFSARRADALGLLAERFLAVAPEADEGLQTADRYLLTIHAPVTALPSRARVDPSDPPALEQGPVLAQETLRRIGCDAALLRILESGDGEPLDVGRKTRVIPPALRRALKRRDGGCRFPGCTHTKFVDGHHIVHWADGGETRLDNLVSVCRRHHRLLHEGGYSVLKRDAEFIFFRPDGLQVPAVNDRLRPGKLEAAFGQAVTGFGNAAPLRVGRGRGFGPRRSVQRAAWEAFANARSQG